MPRHKTEPPQPPQPPQPPVSVSTSTRTSYVTIEHTGRTMKFYNVAEHELESLSMLNDLRTAFAAVGMLLVGAISPDLLNVLFPKKGTSPADLKEVAVMVVFAIAAFGAAVVMGKKSNNLWSNIGSTTKPLE